MRQKLPHSRSMEYRSSHHRACSLDSRAIWLLKAQILLPVMMRHAPTWQRFVHEYRDQ